MGANPMLGLLLSGAVGYEDLGGCIPQGMPLLWASKQGRADAWSPGKGMTLLMQSKTGQDKPKEREPPPPPVCGPDQALCSVHNKPRSHASLQTLPDGTLMCKEGFTCRVAEKP